MHNEVLLEEQQALLPVLRQLASIFGMIGGTAIALHLGHRRSIDFDLCSQEDFDALKLKLLVEKNSPIVKELVNREGEYTFITSGVKMTLLHFPFPIDFSQRFDDVITLPDLRTLAAMKAYALGRRAKWKDYVDLYFILKHHHTIREIVSQTRMIFGEGFNEKLFRSQLSFFEDIDRSEEVIFMPGFETAQRVIEQSLIEASVR